MKKNKAGFTLVELLVVVAIIGTILSLSVISFNNVKTNSRDTKRVSDIKQIQAALELYRVNEGSYPDELALGQSLSSASTTYMKLVPSNQTSNQSSVCSGSNYTYAKEGNSYTLEFCLEKDSEILKEGVHCATSQGIKDGSCVPPFVCGTDSVTYGEESYPTVYIDNLGGHNLSLPGQCWFAKNLNIGTYIGSADYTNIGIDTRGYDLTSGTNDDCVDILIPSCQGYEGIQKYCYNNDQNNCTNYGGLYEWAEALGLPADCNNATTTDNGSGTYTINCTGNPTIQAKQKGICPTGWHIPTNAEWHTLELIYTDDVNQCNAGLCYPAGTALKTGGISDFNAPILGYRYASGLFINTNTYFWTSVPDLTRPEEYYFSWNRYFDSSPTMRGYPGERTIGASIRCLKD